MKYHDRTVPLLLLGVLCASIALADTTVTIIPSTGVDQYRSTTKIGTKPTFSECWAANRADAEQTKKLRAYRCIATEKGQILYTAPVTTPPPPATLVEKWVPIARFGRPFTLTSAATVRYGHKDYLSFSVQQDLPAGSYYCDFHQFQLTGSVPSPRCEKLILAADDGWDYLAIDNDPVVVMPYNGVARYTADVPGTGWAEQTIAEGVSFPCHFNFFGQGAPNSESFTILCKSHPAGVTPSEVVVTAPMMSQMVGMPIIDNTMIPPPSPFGRTGTYTTAQVLAPTAGSGEFRITCKYSHHAFNDPIVYPNMTGAAHLHTFFGATNVDAFTNQASLQASPSTCHGGSPDQSAYWIPAVLGDDGLPVYIENGLFYYKVNSPPNYLTVIWPPNGLKLITGALMMNDDPLKVPEQGRATFPCIDPMDGHVIVNSYTFPSCPTGKEQWIAIAFPNCWDGVNLDSPDHRGHVVFSNPTCPSSHPVQLVQISLNIRIPVPSGADTTKWKVSSDKASLPNGGAAMHADVWVQWDSTADTILQNCIRTSLDCHEGLLGNGLQLD